MSISPIREYSRKNTAESYRIMLHPMTSARLRREAAAPGARCPAMRLRACRFGAAQRQRRGNAAESSLDELTPLQRAALVSRLAAPGTLTEEFDFSKKMMIGRILLRCCILHMLADTTHSTITTPQSPHQPKSRTRRRCHNAQQRTQLRTVCRPTLLFVQRARARATPPHSLSLKP